MNGAGAIGAVIWVGLAGLTWAAEAVPTADRPLLTPAPKQLRWTSDRLLLGESPVIEVGSADLVQVGRLLAAEMERLYGLRPEVVLAPAVEPVRCKKEQQNVPGPLPDNQNLSQKASDGPSGRAESVQGRIELFLCQSAEGKARLPRLPEGFSWPPPRNPQEGYLLAVDRQKAWVAAETPRGCMYGCQTLLQLIQTQFRPQTNQGHSAPGKTPAGRSPAAGQLSSVAPAGPPSPATPAGPPSPATPAGPPSPAEPTGQLGGPPPQPSPSARQAWIPGVWMADWPHLAFRGVHLCIFPHTELAAIRQAILWAGRFKCNAVVVEPWASLRSRRRPETAYPHAYSPEEVRPLVLLGRALQMEMIPMLNSWGHASGMRSRSGEHVVLDRFPEFRDLYEADGWSFRLANPATYEHLFDRYEELLELFGPVRYFHVGMDEAWGHLGAVHVHLPPGKQPHELAAEHLLKLHHYFAQRKIQLLMWHDMLVRRGDPELGGAGPACSIPPYHTHLALEKLPRDIIIAAWNYDVAGAWPIPKYFRDKGFPVVVCPWKSRRNTIFLVNLAKELDLLGVLATTWDSLDVSLPSVAQAAVLAWEAPKSDLGRIPFDHWLAEIRKLPICNLPHLETTLQGSPR
jgi:hypothetical protein